MSAAQNFNLPNGDLVVVDPEYDRTTPTPAADVGAVYWYEAGTGQLRVMLQGSTANDKVGSGGITVTGPGKFVISSPLWDNGSAVDAGAATYSEALWEGGTLTLSADNSLVGSTTGDQVGSGGVTPVAPELFVVYSPQWDNGAATDAGAVSLGGPSGVFGLFTGALSAENSVVGSTANDHIGSGGIISVGFARVAVYSPQWDNGTAANAGAVTLMGPMAFAATPNGEVSADNSLVGASANDHLASGGIILVGDGSFVVLSPLWDNAGVMDAGAVTMGALYMPLRGVVAPVNSLVGTAAYDQVGSGGVIGLGNQGYMVCSPLWDNGAAADAGAVTQVCFPWVGSAVRGEVSDFNSLVGSTTGDQVGSGGITLLGEAGFVVRSPQWDNGAAADAGAVTTGFFPSQGPLLTGVVATTNSLVGSSANDQIGSGGITLLGEMGFVVRSPQWDNGAASDAGAVTTGFFPSQGPLLTGEVSADNSLVGSSASDQIGSGGITLLGEMGFVVRSPQWDNGAASDAGAVTTGFFPLQGPLLTGVVAAANSLVGSTASDQIGSGGITVLNNNTTFLVSSPLWNHRIVVDAGAVTRSDIFQPVIGAISRHNSLVGTHPNDQIGSGGVTLQSFPTFTVHSPQWCYGAGAVTHDFMPFSGILNSSNSTVGMTNAAAEFALQQPSSTDLSNGDTRFFGSVSVGSSAALTFTIKNKGTHELTIMPGSPGVPILIGGGDASMFTVEGQPPDWLLMAGEAVSFTVHFTPTRQGAKSTALAIMAFVQSPITFNVSLTGTGLAVPLSDWRQTHFGTTANSGNAADTYDQDEDGLPNLVEYAFGHDPVQSGGAQLPMPVNSGGHFTTTFTEPGHVTGITYGAEWSTSLSSTGWQPVTDTGIPPQHIFSVPVGANTRLFMRLIVTASP